MTERKLTMLFSIRCAGTVKKMIVFIGKVWSPKSGAECDKSFGAQRSQDLVKRAVRIYLQDNYIRFAIDSGTSLEEIGKNVADEKWVSNWIGHSKTNRPSNRVTEFDPIKLSACKTAKEQATYLKTCGIVAITH